MLNPTGEGKPVEGLFNFKGLNDQNESVFRPKGTTTEGINVWDEQAGDANRRYGRDYDSSASGAIGLLYQISWGDGSQSFIYNNGSSLQYEPFVYPDTLNGNITATLGNPNSPGPMPQSPAGLVPFIKNNRDLPDFTSFMRAVSEARRFATNGSDFTWPNQIYGLDFYYTDASGTHLVISNIRDKRSILANLSHGYKASLNLSAPQIAPPANGTQIEPDFYWVDYFVGGNALIASNLNTIRINYNTTLLGYLKTNPVEGASTISNYAAPDQDPFPVTPLGWHGRAPIIAANINNNLQRVQVAGSLTGVIGRFVSGLNSLSSDVSTIFPCLASVWPLHAPADPAPTTVTSTTSCSVIVDGFTGLGQSIGGYIETKKEIGVPECTAAGFIAVSNVQVNLTTYPFEQVGTTDVFFFVSKAGGPSTLVANQTYGGWSNIPVRGGAGTYSQWQEFTPIGGQITTSGRCIDPATPPSTYITPPVNLTFYSYGFTLTLPTVVVQRLVGQTATFGGQSSSAPAIITPDEFFSLQTATIATTAETFISWGTVKRSDSGAADRSYPEPSALGGAVNISPSTTVLYSSNSQGFDHNRFLGDTYRPTILLILQLSTIIFSGSPTQLTVKLYINNTLVQTTVLSSVFGGLIFWAFSILDVGQFTDVRPPNNNAAADFDGWPAPNVKVSVTTDTGSVSVNTVTKLVDYVVNYPV